MRTLLIFILTLFTSPAFAHGIEGSGFMAGLMHPVFGLDHLLAMVSVGILSVQIGGKAIWSVPSTFLAMMVVGGILGIYGFELPLVEIGIALSVLVLGIALAADKHMPLLLSMGTVGFFAIFHGHAHGTEMPYVATPVLYALGFVLSTATMHLCGVVFGLASKQLTAGHNYLRLCGLGIAGMGGYYLFA